MPKIFISYRTGDDGFAAVEIANRLKARFGAAEVFRDSVSVPPGTDFDPVLWRSLAASSVVVAVIGPHWLTGAGTANRLADPTDFVRRELELAFRLAVPVLPVLVNGSKVPGEADVPADARQFVRDLGRQQYRRINARSADTDVAALVETVADLLLEPGRDRPGTVLLARSTAAGAAPELAEAMRAAAVDIGLTTTEILQDGDVVMAVQPDARHVVTMAGDFVRALATRVADARVGQVKLALDHDARVVPPPEATLDRLRGVIGEPALDSVLAAMTGAPMVVALGEALFRMAAGPGHASVDRAQYAPLRGGDGQVWWIQVPGRSSPRGLPPFAAAAREKPGQGARQGALDEPFPGARAERRSESGNAISVSHLAGDLVLGDKFTGDKHVHGPRR